MHKPSILNRMATGAAALALFTSVMPFAAPDTVRIRPIKVKRFSRHTHLPKSRDAKAYAARRKRPRGTASTLKKTARLLAKLAGEARR